MTARKRFLSLAVAAVAALVLAAPSDGALGQCPGGTTSATALPFPQYSGNIGNDGVVAMDNYVYSLGVYGMIRTSIANPDAPGPVSQLGQVGLDRTTCPTSPVCNGGKVVVDCDCHSGGVTMAVAENPATGESRLFSDWEPYYENQAAMLAFQAVRGVGGSFDFGQQINVSPGAPRGTPLAAIYLPSGKFFGYIPSSSGVRSVDLSVTTGSTGQTCDGGYINCHTDAGQALQGTTTLMPAASGGLWAGQAVVGGQTKYILVGAGGPTLTVAFIDPTTGVPTPIGSVTLSTSPYQIAIATVKGGAYIFSGEYTDGIHVYEIRANNSIVEVQQPPELQGIYKNVVVKGTPGSPTPLLFGHKSSPASVINVFDTNWLTPGSAFGGTPRLGASFPHLGNFINGAFVGSASFGAKVVQAGSIVNAYVFQVVSTSPEKSIASTKKDVSCIAADPLAPPFASFVMANLTAQAQTRVGTNFYGDRWRIQDTTSTGTPLTGVEWQLIAPDLLTTSIVPNPVPWSYTGGAPVPLSVSTLDNGGAGIIWPCDPAIAGNPNTGANCFASLGAATVGPTFVFDVKDRSTNPNPPPSIAANSQTVQKPTAYVNGQTGGAAVVQVLSGAGVLDALGNPKTQGNTAEAAFAWHYTTCTGPCPSDPPGLSQVNPVPPNVTGFTFNVTYKDGFAAAPVAGTIVQRDLIVNPGFSLAPSTVLTGGTLTLTNLMQKAPLATITAVNYAIKQGASPIANGSLNSNFFFLNGTDSIGVPAPIGAYTIALTYIYNGPVDGSGASQVTPAQSFSVTTFTPNPIVNVFLTAGGYPNFVQNPTFGAPQLVIGNTYYLQDYESVPPTVGHPGAQYYFFNGSSLTPVGSQTSPVAPGQPTPTVPFSPSAACASGCYVRAVVQGVSNDEPVTITTTAQPLSVSVSGPSSGTPGVGVQFTANATGGQAPYSYSWDCDVQFLPNFVPGSAIQPCTYATSGFHNVQVKVVDGLSNTATSPIFQITVGGGGGGGLALTLGGPTTGAINQPLTFTANASGGSGGYTYTWKPGESPLFEPPTSTGTTPSYSHTYTAAATYVVICTVTSGATTAQATRTVVISGQAGPPSPSSQYTVSGASLNGQNYDVEAGRTITLTASELPANVAAANGYTWDFADGSPKHGQQVTYSFPATGSRAVSLTVVGDGVHRAGTAAALIPFNVIPPSFQALMVPSAEHSAVFADPSGALKFWATDISVVNQGTAPVTVSPAFLSFTATQQSTFDLSTIPFDPSKKVTIPAKGIWSQVDIVRMLAGEDANKGTLVLKYEGGDATPLATSRVYFAPASDPLGPSAGSAIPSVKATKDGQVVTQGTQVAVDQALPGLRGDAAYYFRVNLFNSASVAGVFRLSAVDEVGNAVTITDPRNGTPSSYVDFPIGPYQAVDWSNDSLGLNDPAKRYVLKARRAPDSSTGRLIATAASRDRFTRDQVLITSDAPPELRENCSASTLQQCVNYVVPGASRFQSPSGAHWRTGLSIYNPSQTSRGIGLEYRYQDTSLANAEKLVTGFAIVGPGKLVYWDDVVAQVFSAADATLADPENGTAGVLKVQHFVDGETTTSPLIISARNYDDQPAGTVGSQLSVYTQPLSLGPTDPAQLLAGLQADMTDGSNPKPRFETIVSVFAYDDLQTVVRLTSLKSDGTVLGSHDLALNQAGASGHFQPRNLSLAAFNAVINEPVTIKVEVLSGGRIGAYALVRDITTRDPTYVQARPQ